MDSGFTYTTVAACQIAAMDRQRFNEHVAAGRYPCAPATVSGRSRLFSEVDIIALFVFARLLDGGAKPESAGRTTCLIRRRLEDAPAAEIVSIATVLANNTVDFLASDNVDVASGEIAGCSLLSLTKFNVGRIREIVSSRCKDMNSKVGTVIGIPDDE